MWAGSVGADVTHIEICILFTVSTDVSSKENHKQISLRKKVNVNDIKFYVLCKI